MTVRKVYDIKIFKCRQSELVNFNIVIHLLDQKNNHNDYFKSANMAYFLIWNFSSYFGLFIRHDVRQRNSEKKETRDSVIRLLLKKQRPTKLRRTTLF